MVGYKNQHKSLDLLLLSEDVKTQLINFTFDANVRETVLNCFVYKVWSRYKLKDGTIPAVYDRTSHSEVVSFAMVYVVLLFISLVSLFNLALAC